MLYGIADPQGLRGMSDAVIGRSGIGRHVAYVLRSNPSSPLVASLGALLLLFVALFAPVLVPYDPVASNVPNALQPPSAAHWAGTDQLGRDILSRILAATRLDLHDRLLGGRPVLRRRRGHRRLLRLCRRRSRSLDRPLRRRR